MENERMLAYKAAEKLNEEELEVITGASINFGNCNFHDFGQATAAGAVWGGGMGRSAGPWGAVGGAATGAFWGGAVYAGTCWW